MAALPWFAFDRIAYITNTTHLTTEEHGAYLLLMLTYYGTEKPLPGYDRALASIAKLPLERWLTIKVGLEPFFIPTETPAGTVWKHERIEAELLEASLKHASNVARAKAGADAMLAKRAGRSASSQLPAKPKPPPKPRAGPKPATSQPQAEPGFSSEPAHLHKHITLSSERVNARAEGQNGLAGQEGQIPPISNPNVATQLDLEEAIAATAQPAVVVPFNPLGTPLPPDWTPDDQDQECARAYGMTDMDIESELLLFHARAADKGMFSQNWKAAWQTFCARWKEMQANKRKPRVEVNSGGPVAPTEKVWEMALGRWQRDQSGWSFKHLGPEPGQPGCKVPLALLQKFGIDPATGIYRAPASIRETTT